MTITPTQGDLDAAREIHGTISRKLVKQCRSQGVLVTVGEFNGAPDHWLTQIIALHAQAARIEGAKAMQEAAAAACRSTYASSAFQFELGTACADAITSLDPHTITGEAG